MRSLHGVFCVAFALAIHNPAKAGSTIDYSAGGGWTSNIFKDPTRLRASFSEVKLGLRGSFDLEDSQFAYGLTVSGRRVPRYRFVDERKVGLEAGQVPPLPERRDSRSGCAADRRRRRDPRLAPLASCTASAQSPRLYSGGNHGSRAATWRLP